MPPIPIPLSRQLLGKVTMVTEANLGLTDVRNHLKPFIRADRLNDRVQGVAYFKIRDWRAAGLTWEQIGVLLDAGYTAHEINLHVRGIRVIKDSDRDFLRALS